MSLHATLSEIVEKDPHVEFGVAVRHLESGEETCLNAEAAFPTASVFKVPVMVEVFQSTALIETSPARGSHSQAPFGPKNRGVSPTLSQPTDRPGVPSRNAGSPSRG